MNQRYLLTCLSEAQNEGRWTCHKATLCQFFRFVI